MIRYITALLLAGCPVVFGCLIPGTSVTGSSVTRYFLPLASRTRHTSVGFQEISNSTFYERSFITNKSKRIFVLRLEIFLVIMGSSATSPLKSIHQTYSNLCDNGAHSLMIKTQISKISSNDQVSTLWTRPEADSVWCFETIKLQ